MRILFVTATYLPTVNGVSYHISDSATTLRHLGHQVMILAPNNPASTIPGTNVIRYPSIPNPYMPTYPLGLPICPYFAVDQFHPDVVHIHHPFVSDTLGITISRRFRIPLFFTSHTQYHEYLKNYFSPASVLGNFLITRHLTSLARRCHAVICPTPETNHRFQLLGITNTTIVPNGVDTSQFYPSPLPSNYSRLKLIYVGRLDREKNLPFLIATAQSLAAAKFNFELQIIGSGSQEITLRRDVDRLRLTKHVFFTGNISRQELPSYYRSSQLFITPSVTEVLPLTILEAMASGLPVIALTGSHLSSLIISGKNGQLVPPHIPAIVRLLTHLQSHPKVLNRMSKHALSTAENYSLVKSCTRLVSLYHRFTPGN